MNDKKITKDMQEKIAEMQMLQQRLAIFANQKQVFQIQQMDIENALRELKTAKSPVYKLVGEILIEKSADELEKELEEKKSDFELKIKSLNKQEEKLKEKALELQQEVTKNLK